MLKTDKNCLLKWTAPGADVLALNMLQKQQSKRKCLETLAIAQLNKPDELFSFNNANCTLKFKSVSNTLESDHDEHEGHDHEGHDHSEHDHDDHKDHDHAEHDHDDHKALHRAERARDRDDHKDHDHVLTTLNMIMTTTKAYDHHDHEGHGPL
ncbi:DUF2796 domain-containing protein [Vibrio chagasii]|nr:DUF2796 domain-containing protein [Vibrio chagasii]